MTDLLFTSILVSGADARSFLQGQLSCDIDLLSRDKPLLASLNSAQGRVQAVLNLIQRDDGIVLSVASSMAEQTIQRLRKYVLRSKVKIEVIHSPLTQAPGPIPQAQLLAQLRLETPIPETHEPS